MIFNSSDSIMTSPFYLQGSMTPSLMLMCRWVIVFFLFCFVFLRGGLLLATLSCTLSGMLLASLSSSRALLPVCLWR